MHYMSIDWRPALIALCAAVAVAISVRAASTIAQRIARTRTRRAIDRVLREQDDNRTA